MNKTIHMIGSTHIDPVWLWHWTEGFLEVKATFRSALDRMIENPDFCFTCSSSLFLEWVESNNPAMLEEIKARVAEGRWELAGGWLIEPDCNLPCGEAFARQGLLAQRYLLKTFGKLAKTGYNVDSFGHSIALPQILKKSGIENYVFLRPEPKEMSLPVRTFRWQSQDGSEVLAYRIPHDYCVRQDKLQSVTDGLKAELNEGTDELMLFYGVGNHGGGPTKANIAAIRDINAADSAVDSVFSTTTAFFDSLRAHKKALPVIQKELANVSRGCYSAHAGMKLWNRKAENTLLAAEKCCTIAHTVMGTAYPADLTQGWKDTLFNQFHDILAGSAFFSAYEKARDLHGEAMTLAERCFNDAFQALSWAIDIPPEAHLQTKPLVVFNPHAFGGPMLLETEMRFLEDMHFYVLDEDNKPLRAQRVQPESVGTQGKLVMIVDMPPMGYRTLRVFNKQEGDTDYSHVTAEENTLENTRWRLEIDPESGNLKRLYDKKNGMEVLSGEGLRLVVMDDPFDTWGHDMACFDKQIGVMEPVYIRVAEKGPVRSAIRVKYRFRDSYALQEFRLYHDSEAIEVKLTTDWREPRAVLKVAMPLCIEKGVPTYEIPFGYVEREADGNEEAGQMWVDLSGTHCADGRPYGLAVANNGKYGFDCTAHELRMTVLRNATYAHTVPHDLDPELEYEWQDSGVQSFKYALLPHLGSWKESNILRVANELNQPTVSLFQTFHPGPLPQKKSFLSIDNPAVIVTALKEAEDKDGVILRAYEAHNKPADANISLNFLNRGISASFTPCEIKTFKVPYDLANPIQEVDLLERG